MKMPWLKVPLAVVLTTALPLFVGCRAPGGPEVYLAPGIPFRLRPPREGPALFVTQEVVFRLPGGAEETAIAVLENRGGTFSVVASSPMGQTLFVVQVKGPDVTVDTRIPIPGDLDPRVLPGLVQLVLWPAAAVREGLGPGVELREEGTRRSLVRKGKTVWTADRNGALLVLDNPGLHLRVQIRTLEP
jgi:hypothetical protein